MPKPDSHRRNSLILNGHRFADLSNDEPPVEFPTEPVVDITVGPSGRHYRRETNERGGMVKVKLFPDSADVNVVLGWREMALADSLAIPFSGSYYSSSRKKTTTLSGGSFVSCPAAPVPGQTFEVTFDFERIVTA